MGGGINPPVLDRSPGQRVLSDCVAFSPEAEIKALKASF